MKRQPYFPRTIAERPGWFNNYAVQLPVANDTLGLTPEDVGTSVNDALFCEYACGAWLMAVREFGPAGTAALENLYHGTGSSAIELPVFTVPPLAVEIAPVPPGALERIFAYVQTIKASPFYTEAIGLQLQIIGSEDTPPVGSEVPEFTLQTQRDGADHENVRVSFIKAGHQGVVIYSKRGGGDWEMLGIDLMSPYLDERPLLEAGKPEQREYRLQYYHNAAPQGDYSPISTITVSP